MCRGAPLYSPCFGPGSPLLAAVKSRRLAIAVAALTLCVLGVAGAQTRDLSFDANVPPGAEANLPPSQQLVVGRQSYERMEQALLQVRASLEQARSARDVVKTLCLTDKVNQMQVAIRTAKDRVASLGAAVEASDPDRSRHEFMIVLVLRDRVDQLAKEANQCIGEEAGFIGQSELRLEIDPNIPDNNPDQLGADPGLIDIPPDLSSPTF